MRISKIVAMFAILAVVAVQVFAQDDHRSSQITSPTQTATAGVFTSDAEDSMDVHDYLEFANGDGAFEKWAGFVGVDNDMASLGFALKPGPIYLGLWYNGNALSTNKELKETVITTYDLQNRVKAAQQTVSSFDADSISSNNSLQALVGVFDMGIKVGFKEKLTSWKNPDNREDVVTVYYDGRPTDYSDGIINEYSKKEGWMVPSLEWGMTIADRIHPYAGVDFGIKLDKEIKESKPAYKKNNTGKVIGDDETKYEGKDAGYLLPTFTLGADYDLSDNMTVGLEFGFSLGILNRSYDVAGFSGDVSGVITEYSGSKKTSKTATSTTTTNEANISAIDVSYMSFGVTPSFSYTIGDGFKLGFSAEVPVGVEFDSRSDEYKITSKVENTSYTINSFTNTKTVTETVSNPGVTDTTTITVSPLFALGASYPVISNKFIVNAGVALAPLTFTNTKENYSREKDYSTKTETTYVNGKLTGKDVTLLDDTGADYGTEGATTDSQTIKTEWKYLTIAASAGFTFNFNQNMFVDMAINGGNDCGGDNFVLDIANVKVLFGLKF